MMKKLKLELKGNRILLVAFLILFLSIPNIYYCVGFNDNTIKTYSGPIVVRENRMTVTGDSYAGKFFDFEKDKDLKLTPYARAGKTIDDNKYVISEALGSSDKNVLISIGVNDQFFETPPYRFEFILRSILNLAIQNNKTVYFHSYLKYFSYHYYQKKYKSTDYDNIIRQLCLEYYNAHYIDVLDLETTEYISDDNLHYNSNFYDELYNRLIMLMYSIEN